jgi:predicted Fe-Mo cluster-binding NifX family protein
MKLVIPLDRFDGLGSPVSDHFGSAPFYALVETDTGAIDCIDNRNQHHDHGQCTPADQFAGMGVQGVLCNGIGARAASRLRMLGIEIWMAGLAPTLAEALERYGNGSLTKVSAQQACSGHDCH